MGAKSREGRTDEASLIDVNDGRAVVSVPEGESLLSALRGAGVFVPSVCGGKGACGACRCRMIGEAPAVTAADRQYLTTAELGDGQRLACQVFPREDLRIAIPEGVFAARHFDARVDRIRSIARDIREVRFDLNGAIDFHPGQYVQLIVPPHDRLPESVLRAYSMASSPADRVHVEVLVRLVPGGIASGWVHNRLREGDSVELVGPYGDFGLRPGSKGMIWVAGSSGLAPFASMLRSAAADGSLADRDIWFFFGARSGQDLFWLEELRSMQANLPRFRFVPALSEPGPEDGAFPDRGLITTVLDRHMKGGIAGPGSLEGYLCGSPGMVNACIKVMTANGMAPEAIFHDKFS